MLMFVLSCSDNTTEYLDNNTVKIGALVPLSGSGSSTGESILAALQLGVTDINMLSSLSYKLNLYYEDTETNPQKALEKLKILKEKGCRVIIGPYSSAELEAIQDYANSNGLIIISPSSVAVSLWKDDNIFRLVSNDNLHLKAISKYLNNNGLNQIAAVYRNDIWGSGLVDSLFIMNAGTISQLDKIPYNAANINSTEILNQLNKKVNDAVQGGMNKDNICILLACFNEGTEILKAATAYPLLKSIKWIGTSAYSLNSTLINLNNYAGADFALQTKFLCPVFAPDAELQNYWQPIENKLITTLGREPESYALIAYDAVDIAWKVLTKDLNETNIEKLKTTLKDITSNYNGITGNMKLDKNGDRIISNYNFWEIRQSNQKYFWAKKYYFNTESGIFLEY